MNDYFLDFCPVFIARYLKWNTIHVCLSISVTILFNTKWMVTFWPKQTCFNSSWIRSPIDNDTNLLTFLFAIDFLTWLALSSFSFSYIIHSWLHSKNSALLHFTLEWIVSIVTDLKYILNLIVVIVSEAKKGTYRQFKSFF